MSRSLNDSEHLCFYWLNSFRLWSRDKLDDVGFHSYSELHFTFASLGNVCLYGTLHNRQPNISTQLLSISLSIPRWVNKSKDWSRNYGATLVLSWHSTLAWAVFCSDSLIPPLDWAELAVSASYTCEQLCLYKPLGTCIVKYCTLHISQSFGKLDFQESEKQEKWRCFLFKQLHMV